MRRAAPAPLLLLLLAGLAVAGLPQAARAQALVADLTSHLVAITTGFTGTSVVLFGATDGGGDVIVVVRGPERDMVVRHKSKVAAVWVNTRQATFTSVPSFYSVASSRPVEEIAPPAVRQLHQIGLEYLRLNTQRPLSPQEATDFRAAFIRNQTRSGLYVPTTGQVSFLGDRLFRATINFPASVPTGTYLVEVFLVRDNAVVSGQTTPLVISEIGVDAEVHDFADRYELAYGLVAVVLAAMAGWLASLPFRNA
ncbi:MAG TPA: TIGR02186 family protein [Stellaceae bacterium]|nr:TIGR02186 family protein [Stellaceae bacterium]